MCDVRLCECVLVNTYVNVCEHACMTALSYRVLLHACVYAHTCVGACVHDLCVSVCVGLYWHWGGGVYLRLRSRA